MKSTKFKGFVCHVLEHFETYFYLCVCVWVPVSIVSRVYRGQRKGEVAGSLELELVGDYEIPAWSWDLNPGPGEERHAR